MLFNRFAKLVDGKAVLFVLAMLSALPFIHQVKIVFFQTDLGRFDFADQNAIFVQVGDDLLGCDLIVDPNVDDATYDLTLGDGRKLKIKVHKNPDGTIDTYMH